MPNSQIMMGAIAALLLVAVVLLIMQMTNRPPNLGDSLKGVVQEIKKK